MMSNRWFLLFLVILSSSMSYSSTVPSFTPSGVVPGPTDASAKEVVEPLPSESHQDSRCVCKCPDVAVVIKESKQVVVDLGGSSVRSVYINSSVTPQECNCEHLVVARLNLSSSQADSFCPRCKCIFQSRNLTVIKVVVILVIWVISILVIYMAFLACLEPLLNKRLSGINYRQYDDSDAEENIAGTPMSTYGAAAVSGSGGGGGVRGARGNTVMGRVGQQQNKWKRQVLEQRRNIYDRHTMLN